MSGLTGMQRLFDFMTPWYSTAELSERLGMKRIDHQLQDLKAAGCVRRTGWGPTSRWTRIAGVPRPIDGRGKGPRVPAERPKQKREAPAGCLLAEVWHGR